MRKSGSGAAPRRIAWLIGLLILLGPAHSALAADRNPLAGQHITFVEPYGRNSVTNRPLALMRDEIARKSGATVEIVTMGGKAGGTALDYVINTPPGGLAFVVLDPISRQLAELDGERAPLLREVQPVARLSGKLSVSLIVSQSSPIRNFEDFLAQAHSRQLHLVHLGRHAAFGLELAMLEKKFGLSFADKVVGTREQILNALSSGEADAGFLKTITLIPAADAPPPPVRPILTFGALRNPKLPNVPTLNERTGDPRADITTATSVFAPRTMPKALVAAVERVIVEVAAEPAIQKAAAADNYPLEVAPPASVSAELARSARAIKAHRAYLDR
jgi:tripartite-type tricarboxylate transporter receptor subunit TctC